MKNQEPTKATGNLEELFRHHLAEAAVPPAPRVWEQVDNALLLAQNQSYRRRLRATRWVAAASLLLASLAGTGWWVQHEARPAEVAAMAPAAGPAGQLGGRERRPAADRPTPPSRRNAAGAASGAATGANATAAPGAAALAATSLPPSAGATSSGAAGHQSPRLVGAGAQRTAGQAANAARVAVNSAPKSAAASYSLMAQEATGQPAAADGPAAAAGGLRAGRLALGLEKNDGRNATKGFTATPGRLGLGATGNRAGAADALAATATATSDRTSAAATPPGAGLPGATEAASGSQSLAAFSPLGGLAVSVLRQPAPALPAPLAPQPLPALAAAETPAAQARRWRLGLSYAAGVFQPNLNFSTAGSDAYGSAPSATSFSLTETAAAEYRAQQRPGLSQRLRLQVSRRLRGHWSLTTGLEVAQQESRSATAYFFTGERLADFGGPVPAGVQRPTTSRYRSAGLPLELRCANPTKTGFSLYGRLGVVVSALLTSRTDVEGSPEATRTYNLLSASTPYRRVLGTARGAVGVQFRPAGHDYTLSLGPVAEGGLWSLNAHPAQSFLSESRPYSFGLEATVEFGRGEKKAQ